MSLNIDSLQFSRQIWQAVSEQARASLLRRDYCLERSRIENLRCVHLLEEDDRCFGQQVWFFEAIGVDAIGRRHMLYGAIELSVQYGLLDPVRSALFDQLVDRQSYLQDEFQAALQVPWQYRSTRLWIKIACTAIGVLALMWLTMVGLYFSGKL